MSKLVLSPTTKPTFSEDCAFAKAKRLLHPVRTRVQIANDKANKTNEGVIHSDLMGPIRQRAFQPAKYVLTYICAQTIWQV